MRQLVIYPLIIIFKKFGHMEELIVKASSEIGILIDLGCG